MLILAVTDFHDRQDTLAPLERTLRRLRPDAVLCLGDLTEHARRGVAFTETFLGIVESAGVPLYCISGNNDVSASLQLLERRGCLVDYREKPLGETRVVGLGYAPSDAPFDPDLRGAILLTHLPPRRDSVPETVTNLPRFHFAGHFHKSERFWKLRDTTVVQVPSAMLYRAATLRLPNGWIDFIDMT